MGAARRISTMLVAFGVLAAAARAQDERPMLLTSEASQRLLETGREQLFDLRLYEGERTFRLLARQPDGAPAAFFHLALSSLLKALVTDERVYFDEFAGRSDSLLERLDGVPASRWRTYLIATAHLHRALAAAKTDHFVRSALAGRSAYRQFQALLEADTTFYEPYAGMGLMHLFIGSLPGSYRGLLKILGYSGSVQQGLAELQVAAERSRLDRDLARTLLALSDVMLNNSAAGGLSTLARLHDRYPNSPLFSYLYGYALLANRRAGEAETQLRAAVYAGTLAPFFYIDYADFYLAQALFRQDRFAEAEPYYRHYLERHRGDALKALARLETGLTLEMQDRRREALSYYRLVNGSRSYDSDMSAYRAAAKLSTEPMTALDRQLLLGRNAYDAGRYARAESLLQAVSDHPGATPSMRAEAAYRLGRVYQAEGRLPEALEAYRYVVAHRDVDSKARWAPWSQFYIGEIYAQHGDTLQATRAYREALSYDASFDYRQSLEQQAKAALGRIRGGG